MKHFKIKMMLAMLMAEVLATIEITMIYAGLRFMVQDFGTPDAVGWTITSFLLSSAVASALCGRLGDMYDRKRILLIVIAVAIVGAVIAATSPTLTGVIIGRSLQGITGAVMPLCVGILRQHIDSRSLPMYIGVLTAMASVSAGLGMLFGGIIVDLLNWRWIFYSIAIVGVLAWFSVYLVLPTSSSDNRQPGTNYLGGILFAPALVFLMVGLTQGQDWGWTNGLTLSLLIAGTILMVAWCRSELKAEVPLLNIRLVFNREIMLAYVATLFLALTWNQFGQTFSLLLQQPTETGAGLGLSASKAGLIMQPQSFMALVGGPLAGWCFVRFGARFTMISGATVMFLAWVGAMIKHDTIPFIVMLLLAMGVSSAYLYSTLTTIIARAAPEHRTSEALGMLTVLRSVANAIGTVWVFHLLSTSTVPGPDGRGEFPTSLAYLLTMGYIAAGSLLIAALYTVFYRGSNIQEPVATTSI